MSEPMGGRAGNGAGAGPEVLRRAIADAESRMASATDQLAGGMGFVDLLGQAAQNAAALTRINADAWDLVLRSFRMVGRSDVHRLGRRMTRIDDKLETILEELETLRGQRPDDEVA
jgi:hypothetical protein